MALVVVRVGQPITGLHGILDSLKRNLTEGRDAQDKHASCFHSLPRKDVR